MLIFSSNLQAYSVHGLSESFHEWKTIPLYFTENVLGKVLSFIQTLISKIVF